MEENTTPEQPPVLTLEDLKEMKPKHVIASGEGEFPEITEDFPVKWVAIRGGYHDFAIYYGHQALSWDIIKRVGNKLQGEATIRFLVPCTDEAYKMYRH